MLKARVSSWAVVALSCSVSTAALAQGPASPEGVARGDSPAAGEATTDTQLTDIVVTAQRRSERLQDVPISVQAASAQQLTQAGVKGIQDLGTVIPSLSVSSAVGFAITYLRGVGTTAIGPGIEVPVSIYVDGVYYASSQSALFDFTNIDHVEVLKGPQGTLFGRNATGGLIQVITKDPTQDFHLKVGASIDNYATAKGDVYVAGGVTEGVAADLAISLSGQGRGWGKNFGTGNDVNKTIHNLTARSKWVFQLGDRTKATLIGDYTEQKHSFNGQTFFPGTNVPASLGGSRGPGDEWDQNGDVDPREENRNWGGSLKLQHEFEGFTLTNIAAYRHSRSHLIWDVDYTPLPHFTGNLRETEKQFSEELQLSSNGGGPFVWTAGLFYFRARGIYNPAQVISLDVPNNLFGPFDTISPFGNQLTESISGYAQGSYEILPETNLTVGARYSHEKREIVGRTEATFFGDPTPVLIANTPGRSLKFSKPTFRVALDHRFSPEVLAYVSFNTGFKSGGFNTQSPDDPAFLPETIKAYEAGIKTDLFDRRVRLNAAGFYYDYQNIQVQKITPLGASGIQNGASARIYGAELELDAQVTRAFRLSGSASWVHAKFRDFPGAPFTAPGGGVATFPGDASGNDIPKAPRFQANLSATYIVGLNDGSAVDLNITGVYSTHYFLEPSNVVRQDAYGKLNASVAWTSPNERYSIRLFGNNLTNKAIAVYSGLLPEGYLSYVAEPPRTFGIKLQYKL